MQALCMCTCLHVCVCTHEHEENEKGYIVCFFVAIFDLSLIQTTAIYNLF